MGIGRRAFLRLTGLALAGMIIDPLKAIAINDNAYVNKKLGILFHKPDSWNFVAVKDFGKLKNEQVIGKGLDLTTEEIWKELGDPICVATKYSQDNQAYQGIFSPTITLNVTPKQELEYLGHKTFDELISISEYGTSKILNGFKVIRQYEPYFISNCKFFESDAEYMFEHVEIKQPLKVEMKTLRAEHNDFYYDFNCHQSKAQNQYADKEFEAFKKTIKLI